MGSPSTSTTQRHLFSVPLICTMSTVFRLPLVLFFKLEHPDIHFCPDSLFSPLPAPLCFLSIYFASFLLLFLLVLSQLMTTNTQMVSLSPSLSALSVSHATSLFPVLLSTSCFLRPRRNVSWFSPLRRFSSHTNNTSSMVRFHFNVWSPGAPSPHLTPRVPNKLH